MVALHCVDVSHVCMWVANKTRLALAAASMPVLRTVDHITLQATRLGDKLLDARGGCSLCKPETGGLGTAAIDLLQMADVLQGRGEGEGRAGIAFRLRLGGTGDLFSFMPQP